MIHYCVANMPAAYARTASQALGNVTEPYIQLLAGNSLEVAVEKRPDLGGGINVRDGRITCRPVAEAHGKLFDPENFDRGTPTRAIHDPNTV